MKTHSPPETAPATSTVAQSPSIPRWLYLLGLVAICVLAAGVRAIPWREVFTSDGLLFFDGDSYYHMRRILYSIRNFPAVLELDPYMNFPQVGVAPWPPGFDLPVALFLRIVVGTEDVVAIERVAAWVPVGLGVAVVALTAAIGRRLGGQGVGLLAAALLAILPAGVRYTRLGFVDHHAAVACLGVLVLWGLVQLTMREDSGPRLWPLWAGLLAAGLLFVWPGALIHLGVAQLVLLVWMWGAPTRRVAVARIGGLSAAHALAAVVLAPYALGRAFGEFGDFTPLALTSFQPTYFGCAAACLAVVAGLWAKSAAGDTAARRFGVALGVGFVGLLMAFIALPELVDVLDRSAGWFTGAEGFNQRIIELNPLLPDADGTLGKARFYFAYLLFAFPIAWVVVVARRKEAGGRWTLGVWSLAFALATLSQERFMNTFAAAFCLVWAVAFFDVWRWLGAEAREHRGFAPIARTAWVIALVAVLAPVVRGHSRASESYSRMSGESRPAYFRDAALYVGSHSPSPEVADGSIEYGVLCAWGLGHMVRYHADRPVVQDNFGPYVGRANVEAADRYYAATEEAAGLEILDDLRARYVIVDRFGAGVPRPYARASMTGRMIELRGSQGRSKDGAARELVPALVHHRLVYESGQPKDPVRVFERVRGVRVEGRAAPGTGVLAEIALRSNKGRFFYRTSAYVGRDGRYRFNLPYPTEEFGAAVRPLGLYRIRTGERSAALSVSESAVRAGARVAGPSFLDEATE